MGSRGYGDWEEPQHTVEFTPIPGRSDGVAFWLQETPVTQRQFRVWVSSRDYAEWRHREQQSLQHENYFAERPDAPAESLNWFDAGGYCDWLGSRRWSRDSVPVLSDSLVRFGLPLEVEWEYACRAGSDTEFWSGDGEAALSEVGWYSGSADSRIHAVGELPANPFGLYDMHGNVAEWCADVWDGTAHRDRPPRSLHDFLVHRQVAGEAERKRRRVARGGGWVEPARRCRSAFRDWWGPDSRHLFLGFRVCLFPVHVLRSAKSAAARED